MNVKEMEQAFRDYVRTILHYQETVALIDWDLHTGAPKKGREQRAEVLGTMAEKAFEMMTSPRMKEFLDALSEPGVDIQLEPVTRKTLAYYKKEYERNHKIPTDRYREFTVVTSRAGQVWEEAKEKDDFSLFQPYLQQVVDFQKEFLQYWGYKQHPYDTLLDHFEPDMTVEILDRVFGELREDLVRLLKEIQESPHKPRTDFIFQKFDKHGQEAFHYIVLKAMGYDFEAGRLDETVHPFATELNPWDVRITTKYDEYDFRTSVFGTIHEGGHALYEQNVSPNLVGTPLHKGTSMGIHESQSLFWENIVARNRHFWTYFYPHLKQQSPQQFEGVSADEFYRGINVVQPSLIRIEADELTYALHVMVRYEIEKGLITDEISVKDLPGIWNDLMDEYLGVRPPTDREGVLQDVHWSTGDFGYFPSYALGYIYSAQLKYAMDKDLPNFNDLLSEGDLQPIRQWLTENVHQYGRLKKPAEILKDATGEEINSFYLVDYLKKKYREVYKL